METRNARVLRNEGNTCASRSASKNRLILKKVILFSFFVCFSLLLQAQMKSVSENKADQIIGVWRPDSFEDQTIKIITQDRFVWLRIRDNSIISSLGGSYTFDGETYIENIEYGTPNMDSGYFGSKSVFQVRFEGYKKYITGIGALETFNEVWVRVVPKLNQKTYDNEKRLNELIAADAQGKRILIF